MYSGKSGCSLAKWFFRAKVVVIGKVVLFEQKLLYSGKVVVLGQKWLYS